MKAQRARWAQWLLGVGWSILMRRVRIEVLLSVFNISVTFSSFFPYALSSYLSLGVIVAASAIHHTK
ncbi:unnamed protein product [Sphenostylis stenocarpa]|uniref:Uncharacterized protein n=1 Tax=Sphenostylis stenocarpa TaxID=92480 RepID=A0AA86SR31_9FABA|nr:unnamed protein product [Sphenostylis stenocarpa]